VHRRVCQVQLERQKQKQGSVLRERGWNVRSSALRVRLGFCQKGKKACFCGEQTADPIDSILSNAKMKLVDQNISKSKIKADILSQLSCFVFKLTR
jgi:hypothetical protein